MTTLRVISNENYESVLKIGETLTSKESVNDGSVTFYLIQKTGLNIFNYAWLLESHFEVIN